jgi:Rhodopirellula transposase DDE domain
MTPYPPHIEQSMKAFYRSLREHDRRRYAAIEADKLGHGGTEYIARLFGIDPKTIRKGRGELDDLPDGPSQRVRRVGGGRKRLLQKCPEIDVAFQTVLHDCTAGSPTDAEVIWTNLTRQEIVDRWDDRHVTVSTNIVNQLLDRHGYHERKALREQCLDQHPDRNAQFEVINQFKEMYFDSPNPILSMDLKSRELIGNFFRSGTLLTRQTIRVNDHDFPEFATGVVLPHGLYDLKLNGGYVHLGTSHDTSEFACDCVADWWQRFGRQLYPGATLLLLLCDGGGSNPADNDNGQAHLFRADLQRLVNELGIEVRLAHYPPYTSKWNPIEHRLFPHLTRACQGVIFQSLDVVASLMKKARTKTGLTVNVDIVEQVYRTGRKITEAVKNAVRVVRDAIFPRWNYRILPAT